MASQRFKRILTWLDYAWRILFFTIGIGMVFCFTITLATIEPGEDEVLIGAVALIIVGVLMALPLIMKLIRKRRRQLYGENSTTEPTQPLTRKERMKRELKTLMRIIFLAVAGYFSFCAFIAFMCNEKESGFVLMVIGVAFVALYGYSRRKALESKKGSPVEPNSSSDALPAKSGLLERLRQWDARLLAEDGIYTDKHIHTCLNCGHEYEGYFCPNCGQDRRTDTIDWHRLVIGMLSSAVNFDGSTIRTLYELLRHPAVVLRRYLSGQHERYSNPMEFILFAGIAYAIMSIIFPSAESIGFTATGNKIYEVFNNFAGNIVVFQCLLAFLVDFFPLYWAFKRTEVGKRLNQVDFYIIMLYLIGVEFFLRACFCPLTHIAHEWNALRWLIMFCYQFVVLKHFFQLSFFPMLWRYLYRYVLYSLFLILAVIPFLMLDWVATGSIDYSPIADYVFSVLSGGILSPGDLATP